MGNGISFDAGKCKVLLKQATTRMRILSNKLTNQTKVQRREIAELLDKGKIESAHVKVEHIIRDDYYIEVYEILQLYIGLVLARIPLLKAPKKEPRKGPTTTSASARNSRSNLHLTLRQRLPRGRGVTRIREANVSMLRDGLCEGMPGKPKRVCFVQGGVQAHVPVTRSEYCPRVPGDHCCPV